jgi:hypothetical protein
MGLGYSPYTKKGRYSYIQIEEDIQNIKIEEDVIEYKTDLIWN